MQKGGICFKFVEKKVMGNGVYKRAKTPPKFLTGKEKDILKKAKKKQTAKAEERIWGNGVNLKEKIENGVKRYNELGSRSNTGGNRVRNYKVVEFPKELPEWWDARSARLQFYDWIDGIAEKYGVTALTIFRNCGYEMDKHRQFLNAMKKDDKAYSDISIGQIQKIARLTNTPFVLM